MSRHNDRKSPSQDWKHKIDVTDTILSLKIEIPQLVSGKAEVIKSYFKEKIITCRLGN